MFDSTKELLDKIMLGEDSFLELKEVRLARERVTGPTRETLADELRGEGVAIILDRSERLSGRRPEYRMVDESELMLTIWAAQPNEASQDLKQSLGLADLRAAGEE